jgi:hypothetical protein
MGSYPPDRRASVRTSEALRSNCTLVSKTWRRGSTPLDRGQAARAASTSHPGRLPRHLGISAGGTEKLNSSSTDQR